MSASVRAFLAVIAAALPAVAAAEPGVVVDHVVAVIRSPAAAPARVVTLTRLEEETRVALVARGGVLAATAPLDAAALRAGLEWIIEQTLLSEEAARLQILEVEPAEVTSELQAFKARFRGAAEYQAFLARLDLGEEDLSAILKRTLRVKRYVESRVGRAADVPDAEVSAWMATHGRDLPKDPTAAGAAARARIAEERVTAESRLLAADLRRRAEVRVLHDFGGAG